MSVFLKDAHGLDTFACSCCGGVYPRIAIHEHHKIKQAHGGKDTLANIAILDANCHHALHQIEAALKNEKKRLYVPDMLQLLFPNNPKARENCLYFATTALMAKDSRDPENQSKLAKTEGPIDHSVFDTEHVVHLTAAGVSPKVKALVDRVCNDIKNPRTGRKLGVGTYIKLLIEQDLKKRGYKF